MLGYLVFLFVPMLGRAFPEVGTFNVPFNLGATLASLVAFLPVWDVNPMSMSKLMHQSQARSMPHMVHYSTVHGSPGQCMGWRHRSLLI